MSSIRIQRNHSCADSNITFPNSRQSKLPSPQENQKNLLIFDLTGRSLQFKIFFLFYLCLKVYHCRNTMQYLGTNKFYSQMSSTTHLPWVMSVHIYVCLCAQDEDLVNTRHFSRAFIRASLIKTQWRYQSSQVFFGGRGCQWTHPKQRDISDSMWYHVLSIPGMHYLRWLRMLPLLFD